MKRIGIASKIVVMIVVLLALTSAAIILLNRMFYYRDMRTQLAEIQLPLIADQVLAEVDATIMEPSRASRLVADNPFFKRWLREGEPETEQETIFALLDSLRTQYGLLAANFGSDQAKKYYNATNTGKKLLDIEGDAFPGFSISATARPMSPPMFMSMIRFGALPPISISESNRTGSFAAMFPSA